MKMIVAVALALVAVALAAPADKQTVEVKQYQNEQTDTGFQFLYGLTDGSERKEVGEFKAAVDEDNKPVKVLVVRGFYTYIREDGTPETVEYYADESGYHAKGDSIPKNPDALTTNA